MMEKFSIRFKDLYFNVAVAEGAAVRAYFSREPEGRPIGEGARRYPFLSSVERYFSGERVDLSGIPVRLKGTEFQLRVWRALRGIPYGETRSYSWIARAVGAPRAIRAVARAISRNPILVIIPCHRVIRADSSLGGYSSIGGVKLKEELLRLEGALE